MVWRRAYWLVKDSVGAGAQLPGQHGPDSGQALRRLLETGLGGVERPHRTPYTAPDTAGAGHPAARRAPCRPSPTAFGTCPRETTRHAIPPTEAPIPA